jgi:hypothetical protein
MLLEYFLKGKSRLSSSFEDFVTTIPSQSGDVQPKNSFLRLASRIVARDNLFLLNFKQYLAFAVSTF